MNGDGFEIGTDGPSIIMAAIDGSVTSLRAGAYAAGLARRQGSQLVVITVSTTPPMSSMAADAVVALSESSQHVAADLQREAAASLHRLEMEARFVQVHGDPYVEIVRVADELRVDALVVGSSTKAGHRFVGSLAGRLVKAGKWPVTVVP